MKELQRAKDIYLEEYEVNVSPYLEMAQIAAIVEGVCAIENGDFLTRKMNEDMLVLLYGTDIGQKTLESANYEDLVTSGLIRSVRNHIKNIDLVKEGIEYSESFARNLSLLAPKIMPLVEKVGDLYATQNIQNTDKK